MPLSLKIKKASAINCIDVFILAILLLVGSISIAMPSKSSREISKIRMEAQMMGVKISSTIYGKNKFKNKNSNPVSYQIKNTTSFKEGHFIRDKTDLILYSPVKLKYVDNFESIEKQLKSLSKSIDELIFTESFIFFLWKELDGLKELKNILDELGNLKNF